MTRMKKVLVPLDFSKKAEMAYEFAKKHGWEIIVLHVLDEGLLEKIYPFFSSPGFDFKKFVKERRKQAEKALEKYDAVKRIVKTGKPWEEIIKTAEEEDVDLIVMTRRGTIEEVILGSCTERVVRHATKKPVLVVP